MRPLPSAAHAADPVPEIEPFDEQEIDDLFDRLGGDEDTDEEE